MLITTSLTIRERLINSKINGDIPDCCRLVVIRSFTEHKNQKIDGDIPIFDVLKDELDNATRQHLIRNVPNWYRLISAGALHAPFWYIADSGRPDGPNNKILQRSDSIDRIP